MEWSNKGEKKAIVFSPNASSKTKKKKCFPEKEIKNSLLLCLHLLKIKIF